MPWPNSPFLPSSLLHPTPPHTHTHPQSWEWSGHGCWGKAGVVWKVDPDLIISVGSWRLHLESENVPEVWGSPPSNGVSNYFRKWAQGQDFEYMCKGRAEHCNLPQLPLPQGELSLILFLLSKSKIRKRHKVFSLQTESLRGKQAGLEKDSLVLCWNIRS